MPPETRKVKALDNKQMNNDEKSSTEPTSIESNEMYALLQKIDAKSDKHQQDLLATIKQQTDSLRSEFQNHLRELEDTIDNKVESAINIHLNKFNQVDMVEDYNRIAKLNDVILRGIPYKANEKLQNIFDSIGNAVGFKHSSYNSVNNIYRMSTSRNGAPILVQFSSSIMKREFMNGYIKKKELYSKDIGESTNERIYACDNLTKFNYSIYDKALKLLKAKSISKLKTKFGFVYVRYHDSNDWNKINHPNDLQDLATKASNE